LLDPGNPKFYDKDKSSRKKSYFASPKNSKNSPSFNKNLENGEREEK
jgi:hypothetical protein